MEELIYRLEARRLTHDSAGDPLEELSMWNLILLWIPGDATPETTRRRMRLRTSLVAAINESGGLKARVQKKTSSHSQAASPLARGEFSDGYWIAPPTRVITNTQTFYWITRRDLAEWLDRVRGSLQVSPGLKTWLAGAVRDSAALKRRTGRPDSYPRALLAELQIAEAALELDGEKYADQSDLMDAWCRKHPGDEERPRSAVGWKKALKNLPGKKHP